MARRRRRPGFNLSVHTASKARVDKGGVVIADDNPARRAGRHCPSTRRHLVNASRRRLRLFAQATCVRKWRPRACPARRTALVNSAAQATASRPFADHTDAQRRRHVKVCDFPISAQCPIWSSMTSSSFTAGLKPRLKLTMRRSPRRFARRTSPGPLDHFAIALRAPLLTLVSSTAPCRAASRAAFPSRACRAASCPWRCRSRVWQCPWR